jgi:hypothetical protein
MSKIGESRKNQLEVAGDKQRYAVTALVLMTCINVMLATLMVSREIPIWLGMFLSFGIMGLIVYKANKDLLNRGETMWESPRDFHERRRKEIENG